MRSSHPDASAKAPCTSTMVGLGALCAAAATDGFADTGLNCCAPDWPLTAMVASTVAAIARTMVMV